MYTVYDRPVDFPNSVVVRRFTITEAGATADRLPFIVGPDVETVTTVLLDRRPGLYNLGRQEGDRPQIVATWI